MHLLALTLLLSPPALVGPGTYVPLFPAVPSLARIEVPAFRLDVTPVTEADFAAFVAQNPRWRRDTAPGIVKDAGYLRHWASPEGPGSEVLPNAPVVNVSWFAARAFCAARGGRLPTEAEWEVAGLAGDHGPVGRTEPGWTQRILDWYARPAHQRPGPVGQRPPNHWKVHDLHGLVWEWVEDFNAASAAGDREGQNRFCGATGALSSNKEDYVHFMRSAFRSSLTGASTVSSLGFRCAFDEKKHPSERLRSRASRPRARRPNHSQPKETP